MPREVRVPTDDVAGASLSESELGRLIKLVLRRPIPRKTVAALHGLLATEPHALVTIVRYLVDEDASGALDALRGFARGGLRLSARPRPEECVLHRNADRVWEIGYAGRSLLLPDSKGLGYLSLLLASPGKRFWAKDLLRATRGHAPTPELARLSVTKALKATLARVTHAHPELGEHLNATVRRGNFCVYLPDPRRPISWRT